MPAARVVEPLVRAIDHLHLPNVSPYRGRGTRTADPRPTPPRAAAFYRGRHGTAARRGARRRRGRGHPGRRHRRGRARPRRHRPSVRAAGLGTAGAVRGRAAAAPPVAGGGAGRDLGAGLGLPRARLSRRPGVPRHDRRAVGALFRGRRVAAWVALAVGYPMFVWVAPLVAGQPPPQAGRRGRHRPPGWSRAPWSSSWSRPGGNGRPSSAVPGRRRRGGGPARSGCDRPRAARRARAPHLADQRAGRGRAAPDGRAARAGPHRADRDQARPARRRWASCARCSSVLRHGEEGAPRAPAAGPGPRWTSWSTDVGGRAAGDRRGDRHRPAAAGRASTWPPTGSCRRR